MSDEPVSVAVPQETVIEADLDDWIKAHKGGVSTDELLERVTYEAGLDDEDMEDLPAPDKFSAHGLTWEVGRPAPNNLPWMVFAIFYGNQADETGDHMPGDARIYCVPAVSTYEGKPVGFARYTMNRGNASLLRESMGLKAFIEELSYEWEKMADVVFGEDDEEEDEKPEEKEEGAQAAST